MYVFTLEVCVRSPSETHESICLQTSSLLSENNALNGISVKQVAGPQFKGILTRDQNEISFLLYFKYTLILDPSKIILESSSGNETR